MPRHVLRRRLRLAWRQRPFRLVVGLMVLAAIIILDLNVVAPLFDPRIDGLPADVQKIEPGDELVLEDFLGPKDELSLDIRSALQVDLLFMMADLTAEQRRYFLTLGAPLPPPGSTRIAFRYGSAVDASETCHTTLELRPYDGAGPTLTMKLDPEPKDDSRDAFHLRLRPVGGDLRVHAFEGGEAHPAGELTRCGRLLQVGDQELPGVDEVSLIVPEDTDIQMAFFAGIDVETIEPFPFRQEWLTRSLEITSAVGERVSSALRVESAGDSPSIRLMNLELGHRYLAATYKGQGTVKGPRAPDGSHPFEIFKRGLIVNSLTGALLATLNLTLFTWLKKTLSGDHPPTLRGGDPSPPRRRL